MTSATPLSPMQRLFETALPFDKYAQKLRGHGTLGKGSPSPARVDRPDTARLDWLLEGVLVQDMNQRANVDLDLDHSDSSIRVVQQRDSAKKDSTDERIKLGRLGHDTDGLPYLAGVEGAGLKKLRDAEDSVVPVPWNEGTDYSLAQLLAHKGGMLASETELRTYLLAAGSGSAEWNAIEALADAEDFLGISELVRKAADLDEYAHLGATGNRIAARIADAVKANHGVASFEPIVVVQRPGEMELIELRPSGAWLVSPTYGDTFLGSTIPYSTEVVRGGSDAGADGSLHNAETLTTKLKLAALVFTQSGVQRRALSSQLTAKQLGRHDELVALGTEEGLDIEALDKNDQLAFARLVQQLGRFAPIKNESATTGYQRRPDGGFHFATPIGGLYMVSPELDPAKVIVDESYRATPPDLDAPMMPPSLSTKFSKAEVLATKPQLLEALLKITPNEIHVAALMGFVMFSAPAAAGYTPETPAAFFSGVTENGKTYLLSQTFSCVLGGAPSGHIAVDLSDVTGPGVLTRMNARGHLPAIADDLNQPDVNVSTRGTNKAETAAAGVETLVTVQFGRKPIARGASGGGARKDLRYTGTAAITGEYANFKQSRRNRVIHVPVHAEKDSQERFLPSSTVSKAALDSFRARFGEIAPVIYWTQIAAYAAIASQEGGVYALSTRFTFLRDRALASIVREGRAMAKYAAVRASLEVFLWNPETPIEDCPRLDETLWQRILKGLLESDAADMAETTLSAKVMSTIGEACGSGNGYIDVGPGLGPWLSRFPVAAHLLGYTESGIDAPRPPGRAKPLARIVGDGRHIAISAGHLRNLLQLMGSNVSPEHAAPRLVELAVANATPDGVSTKVPTAFVGAETGRPRGMVFPLAAVGIDLPADSLPDAGSVAKPVRAIRPVDAPPVVVAQPTA
ncbi:hypothetical protein C5B85_10770 [Pseudoclavibacter sp. AY1F1]|uniref:hypothetical protein n=1 Tax=Pseudoclavibacter sp. AY1F1 TaxID=2080583 RepID=UPI000CE7BC5C|nr:hypothetical protein [Pseudoclavibacter sp. AY1F1]PPF44120.1 hypothetical protein C5B85_10770 [Pseudoclavibacter sp. AY1F1]